LLKIDDVYVDRKVRISNKKFFGLEILVANNCYISHGEKINNRNFVDYENIYNISTGQGDNGKLVTFMQILFSAQISFSQSSHENTGLIDIQRGSSNYQEQRKAIERLFSYWKLIPYEHSKDSLILTLTNLFRSIIEQYFKINIMTMNINTSEANFIIDYIFKFIPYNNNVEDILNLEKWEDLRLIDCDKIFDKFSFFVRNCSLEQSTKYNLPNDIIEFTSKRCWYKLTDENMHMWFELLKGGISTDRSAIKQQFIDS